MIDRLLEEAKTAAMHGSNEYSVSPMHDFNWLTAAEKVEIREALETLGFVCETRQTLDRPDVSYLVFSW